MLHSCTGLVLAEYAGYIYGPDNEFEVRPQVAARQNRVRQMELLVRSDASKAARVADSKAMMQNGR